jgi:hypothetical protein
MLAGIIAVIGLIWCFGIYTIAGFYDPRGKIEGSMFCGVLVIALAILYLLVLRGPGRAATTEVGGVGIYFTTVYLLAGLGINTVFVLVQHGGFGNILIFLNLVVDAAYLISVMYLEKDHGRLERQVDTVEIKQSRSEEISKKLGTLLGIVEEGDLRKRLLSLKETVDYSSNITTEKTAVPEKQMLDCLDELMALLLKQEEKTVVEKKIHEAELIWKMRSSK